MSFEHQRQDEQGSQLVSLRGRIDSASAATFEQAVLELFSAPGRRAVLDFAGVDYISSAGLRVVLMVAKRAKQGQGQLLLCGLAPHVREVFEISGFLKIIDTVDERATALRQLAACPL
ncbi:anti-anti-sigma factor [Paucibacter oligotrophus]|uniref:Anti-sigma factor antagonist n=1 Tax=Roseateles oligotrophus TaxID=1769250 RepID=A0A840LCM0_9BURK|nr:STAS domain-containing protein [Roseateles oligotrophus]MBB4845910.1 anti-anti-sigma factor [Roseateles oligotrophus]